MTDFKLVPLKEIRPDPNQPRKYYDETAMTELTDSVKEKGILQPILIRPNGKGMILVCGERRYKAATAAGLTEIPAVIRELTDEEALELQITENLQRKDVHPMEEAVAFQSMINNKQRKLTVEEVAGKIGKSVFFIRQRLKLNSLTKEWQEIFFRNKLSISAAILIALIEPGLQQQLYKGLVRPKELNDKDYYVEIDENDLSKVRRELKKAPFDIKDVSLHPLMGSCTSCRFNSAVSALFPDDSKTPTCNNGNCYEKKAIAAFEIKLKEFMEDPTAVLLGSRHHHSKEDIQLIKKLTSEGHKVLESYDDFFPEDSYRYKEIKSPPLKGLYINGWDKGKIVRIKLVTKGNSSTSKKVKSGSNEKLSASEIDNEIQRIRDREKRTKEIDEQRIWSEIRTQFNPAANASMLKGDFTQVEKEAIVTAMQNKLGYSGSDSFNKLFGKKDFSKIDDIKFRQAVRFFFLEVLPPSILYSGYNDDAKVCLKVANEYFPSVLKEIEEKQAAIATKRNERINKRIKDLQAKKKELSVKKKPVAKKPATKKK